MIGEYARLSPAHLERALEDPAWARDFVDACAEAEAERPPVPSERRTHSVQQAWHALEFLLARREFPVPLIHGEEPLPGADDWGYGPPGLITPERVLLAATALEALPPDELVDGVTPADLAAAEIYPQGMWQDSHALEYATAHYVDLTAFVRTAARYHHALLTWIA